jgi:hypothetical protein
VSWLSRSVAAIGIAAIALVSSAEAGEIGSTGQTWQNSSSPIETLRVYSYWWSDFDVTSRMQGPIYFNDCVDFINRGPQTAVDIQFMFASIARDGTAHGPAMPLDVRKAMRPGVIHTELNCRDHAYGNGVEGRMLVGWVSAVTFSDGTSWYAAPAVNARITVMQGSPIHVVAAEVNLPLQECAMITNVSTKPTRTVKVYFDHLSESGELMGRDSLEVPGPLAARASRNACRAFEGQARPDALDYARSSSDGGVRLPPPKIFYKGKESTVRVSIGGVQFEDGTVWNVE